jgi:hypothetical protein
MCASIHSLESLIRIYLEQLRACYFVFDGLDECTEWEEFLISLRKCTEETSCKIVLLARPHLPIEAIIGQKPFIMKLVSDANTYEITAILRPGITALLQKGKLGPRYGPESGSDLIETLARRADCIVLWAELIIKYLQAPYLSPAERVEIIEEEKSFQGLYNLFGKILLDLGKRIPDAQHEKVRKIFGWLAAAQQPWTTKMIETALAVQIQRSSNEADFIDHFEESLIQLCGPLIEIRRDHVVRFIHVSLSQYLTEREESSFSFTLGAAHCSTANVCLSYLLNDVPHGPLSGNASIVPQRQSVLEGHCFLPYAVSFWPYHARQTFEENVREESIKSFLGSKSGKEFSRLLTKITTEKPLVTLWIEASWLFELAPSLSGLSDVMEEAADAAPEARRRELSPLAHTFQRLDKNLSRLNEKWCHVLAGEPNEIWMPSINAFTDSEFWVGTTATKVSWLSSRADTGAILITSQVSSDGKEVGVVKIWPAE